MTFHPLVTKTSALKLQLKLVDSVDAAKTLFGEFVASEPTDAELELASIYYGWTIYELTDAPANP
jgi:hypothetical protein